MTETEYNRVKNLLERFGNTIVTRDVDEIVERLRKDGLDVTVRLSSEMQTSKAGNIQLFGRHIPEKWYVIEKRTTK